QPVPAPIDPMSDPGIGSVEELGVPAMAVAPPNELDAAAREDGEDVGEVEPAEDRPALVIFDPGSLAVTRPTPDAYSLRLVAHRTLYDQGTSVQRSPHLASLVVPATLAVHPTDLERLGLAEGGRVRLHGARGALTIDAAPDPGLA